MRGILSKRAYSAPICDSLHGPRERLNSPREAYCTVPLLFYPTASTCHARTTTDRSVLLFGEANSPTLPPSFSFHSRSQSWPSKTFFWSWMSLMVREIRKSHTARVLETPCKHNIRSKPVLYPSGRH